jgi:hypothetical protein
MLYMLLLFVWCIVQAADLAREAMMSFSASDASKSVLDEIRVFGGLDNIIQTTLTLSEELRDCVSGRDISEPPHGLLAAGRCLRILSNLLSCESNRTYVKNKVNKGLLEAMARCVPGHVLLTFCSC